MRRLSWLAVFVLPCAAIAGIVGYADQTADIMNMGASYLFALFKDKTFPRVLAAGIISFGVALAVAYLIFLVIPVLNAALDALSLVATRLMLGHLRRGLAAGATAGRRALVIAGHTVADLALAVLSLFALAWLLAFAFEWAAQQGLFGAFDSEDGAFVRGMLDAAVAAPFRDGLWLLFMLATTFVPTVVHLVFLTFAPLAVIALPGRRRRELVARL